jgi:hypothetical protein
MKDLVIKGQKKTYLTPDVSFSAETGICEIAGESYQEESFEFYKTLMNWVEEYTKKIKKSITFNFKLTYFNTSSSRAILELLYILKRYEVAGGTVTLNWYYNDPEDSIYEEAEDFQTQSKLHFNMIFYETQTD